MTSAVEILWYRTREGTWNARVRARGLPPQGHTVATNERGLWAAQVAAAPRIDRVVKWFGGVADLMAEAG